MAKVVPFRKSAMKAIDRANAQIDTAFAIRAILRRRTLASVCDASVVIEFDTNIEAVEFQRLVHSLPKMRRRPK